MNEQTRRNDEKFENLVSEYYKTSTQRGKGMTKENDSTFSNLTASEVDMSTVEKATRNIKNQIAANLIGQFYGLRICIDPFLKNENYYIMVSQNLYDKIKLESTRKKIKLKRGNKGGMNMPHPDD